MRMRSHPARAAVRSYKAPLLRRIPVRLPKVPRFAPMHMARAIATKPARRPEERLRTLELTLTETQGANRGRYRAM